MLLQLEVLHRQSLLEDALCAETASKLLLLTIAAAMMPTGVGFSPLLVSLEYILRFYPLNLLSGV